MAALCRHIKRANGLEESEDEAAKERWKRGADRFMALDKKLKELRGR